MELLFEHTASPLEQDKCNNVQWAIENEGKVLISTDIDLNFAGGNCLSI